MAKKFVAFVALIIFTVTTAASDAAYNPDKDPALTRYYSFDGTIGDATPLSKPDMESELSPGGTVRYADGVHGRALYLDGTVALDIGDDVMSGDGFTVAFWMAPEAVTPWSAAFFARRSGGRPAFWLSIAPRTDLDSNPGRHMMLWSCGEGDHAYWFDGVTSVSPEAGKWLHVAVTYDRGEVVVYADGEIVFDTKTATGYTNDMGRFMKAMGLGGARCYIGANEFGDAPYRGRIDEFYAFSRALGQDEVKALMGYDNAAMSEKAQIRRNNLIIVGSAFAAVAAIVIAYRQIQKRRSRV